MFSLIRLQSPSQIGVMTKPLADPTCVMCFSFPEAPPHGCRHGRGVAAQFVAAAAACDALLTTRRGLDDELSCKAISAPRYIRPGGRAARGACGSARRPAMDAAPPPHHASHRRFLPAIERRIRVAMTTESTGRGHAGDDGRPERGPL